MWDGLASEDSYWSAVALLQDPSRTTTRLGRAVHLLSYIVMSGVRRPQLQAERQPARLDR